MSKKSIQWLFKELPKLIDKGIINNSCAEEIKSYYTNKTTKDKKNIALIIFAVVGALLIGMGIILLLAHNWKDLSRFTRTILSIAPLIILQILAGWVMMNKSESIAWRESTSTFLTIMIGSSIALIGQTYHIPGNMPSFLLTWMLLCVPLVYFMRVRFSVFIYLIGITSWASYMQIQGGHAVGFWLLFAIIIPRYWQSIKENPNSVTSINLSWIISICLCIALGVTMEKVLPGLWIVTYASYFSVLYLLANQWVGKSKYADKQPFNFVGSLGIFILSLIFTYKWPWREIGWSYYRVGNKFHEYAAISDYIITAVLLIASIVMLVSFVRKKKTSKIPFGIMPIVALIAYCYSGLGTSIIFPVILFNLYLLVLAIIYIVIGIRNIKLSTVNAGMFMLAALIVARFFDSSISFVIRGMVFIIIGIGFLITNMLLVQYKENVNEN